MKEEILAQRLLTIIDNACGHHRKSRSSKPNQNTRSIYALQYNIVKYNTIQEISKHLALRDPCGSYFVALKFVFDYRQSTF